MHSSSISQRGLGSIGRIVLANALAASMLFVGVTPAHATGTAELDVVSITFHPSSTVYTNDDINMHVTVRNSGSVSAGGFTIDIYVDETPVGCSDWGDFYTTGNMDPNSQSTAYITYRAGGLSAGAHNIYAFVDSGCTVTEGTETDNVSVAYPLNVTATGAAPVHDDIASAKTISALPYADLYVTTSGATRAMGDPEVGGSCDLTPGKASVWYAGTPAEDKRVRLSTTGSTYDTWIAVWTGSPGSLSLVGCNDDAANTSQSTVRVDLISGTSYYIEVADFTYWYGELRGTGLMADGVEAKGPPDSDVGEQAGGTLIFRAAPDLRLADFDGDGPTDIGYFHATTGLWGILESTSSYSYSSPSFFTWGQTGDIVVPGDYDGDKRWDPAVRRPPAGGQSAAYLILKSSTGYDYGASLTIPAGWPGLGDKPVVGDYNGDGMSDPAIWRGNTGVWIIPMSPSFSTYQFFSWGTTGDTPVGADVDGDGTTDIGFWRPSTGVWGFLQSTHGFSYGAPLFFNWGASTDLPVMADYDGDGYADPAVVIPPTGGQSKAYRLLLSSASYDPDASVTIPAGWPALGDTPVPADYDNDGRADAAIWRANTGVWIIPLSATNNTIYRFAAWGASGDQVAR